MESFLTAGKSVEGLPSMSTGVSEIYGSRRRLPSASLPSFVIECLGQLFGFHIGNIAGCCSNEFVIQLLALFVLSELCWNLVLAGRLAPERLLTTMRHRLRCSDSRPTLRLGAFWLQR